MSDNRCVCCGEIIPEGMQTCRRCVAEYMERERRAIFKGTAMKKDKTTMESYGTLAEMTDWADKILRSEDVAEINIRRKA